MTNRSPRRPAGPSRSGDGPARGSRRSERRGPAGRSERPRSRPDAAAPDDDRPSRTARFAVSSPATTSARVGLWRQVLALGLAVAIAGVAVAGPLRSYVARQGDLARAQQQVAQLQAQKQALLERQRQLSDPDYIAAEARRRLQYVARGETVYRIIPPATATRSAAGAGATAEAAPQPWYRTLWDSLSVDVRPHG